MLQIIWDLLFDGHVEMRFETFTEAILRFVQIRVKIVEAWYEFRIRNVELVGADADNRSCRVIFQHDKPFIVDINVPYSWCISSISCQYLPPFTMS